MAYAWLAISLLQGAASTSLRAGEAPRLYEAEASLLKPSSWSIYAPAPLPPRFLIISSPEERIVSYAQVSDDYTAVKGLVKPLLQDVSIPKGLAYDAQHSRLFVADPGARRIRAWKLFLERCLTPEEKAGMLGAAVTDPFTTDAAEGPTACDLPWTLRAGHEVTVVSDVSSEWVSVDKDGNLYYSDQNKKSVNKIDATLLLNLIHGEIQPAELKHRPAGRAFAESLRQEGKEAMEVKAGLADAGEALTDSVKGAAGMLGSASATAISAVLPTVSDDSILELFQAADSPHVATPGGIASDTVQVYWANQDHGFEKGSIGTGFAAPSLSAEGPKTGKLTNQTEHSFGLAVTRNAVIFSDGGAVYGVSKFGGGAATPLNGNFIISRGLVWDGSGSIFVADEGASAVYAMPCSILAENQPIQQVLQLHGAFGLALVQPTDPLVTSTMQLKSSAWHGSIWVGLLAAVLAL
ncbi:unnamed protein product [Effrenium voratum]|uniref:Uncharacterized protein n=1 Tax=Effrenium voratum TaxID=2562239 RepID=A0AA36JFB7_9DINO|nr:unnamed protein product [Effrenium voratum]CAJ1457900.1 unnamed protein product [Effrenium voratum]